MIIMIIIIIIIVIIIIIILIIIMMMIIIITISTSFHGVLACLGLPLLFAKCVLLSLYQKCTNHSRENVWPIPWHPDHF